MKLRSSWFRRIILPCPKCPVSPDKTTTVEMVSAVPVVEDNSKKQSVKVNGTADGAEFGYYGYINKDFDSSIYNILKEAEERDKNVLMRFERRRKEGYDREIEELTENMNTGRESLFRVLAAIYNPKNNTWIKSQNITTIPENDPPEVEEWITSWVLPLGEQISPEEFFEAEKIINKNTKKKNNNKYFNFNEEQALVTFYCFLIEQEKENDVHLTVEQRKKLSEILLKGANAIQKKFVGFVDTDDYSHSRARYIIMTLASAAHPLSEETLNEPAKWFKSILEDAEELTNWLIEREENRTQEE